MTGTVAYYAVVGIIGVTFGCGVLACWMAAGAMCQRLQRLAAAGCCELKRRHRMRHPRSKRQNRRGVWR